MLRPIAIIILSVVFSSCDSDRGSVEGPGEDAVGSTDTTPDVPSDTAVPDIAPDLTLDPVDTTADTAMDIPPDTPPLPTIDPATCGQEPFQWLGSDQVGEVVLWEESEMTDVTAEFIIGTLSSYGYDKLTGLEHTVRNFRVRYTTQDRGSPAEATGMIGIPSDVEGDDPLPVLLWLHPNSGTNDSCAPSRHPLAGPGQTSILSSLGYITVAPDYIGMLGFGEGSPEGTIHPWMIGQPTAIAGLDAIRASLAWLEADPDLPNGDPNRIIVWGGSQGGHGAYITERIQPYYAPELDIIAVAAAIPGTDLLAMSEYGATHWSATSEALTAILVAMQAWYGVGDLADVLTDEEPNFVASSAPLVMAQECGGGSIFSGLDSLEELFTPALLDASQSGTLEDFEPWGCFFNESSVDRMSVQRISDTPFLTTFGELDELAQTSVELAAVARYCADGYRIEYLNCAGLNHAEAGVATIHYMAKWTAARLAGEEWDEAAVCTYSEPVDCDAL